MAVAHAKTYPRFGTNVWWQLRDALRQDRPEVVDVPYLTTQLGQSDKSVRNLLPPFRSLGLIDEGGRLTALADLWIDDATYAQALDEIVRRSYADAAEQFPNPPADRAELETWFAATTGTGENSVRQMASFYLLLLDKDAVSHGDRKVTSSSNESEHLTVDRGATGDGAVEAVVKPPVSAEPEAEPRVEYAPVIQTAGAPVLHLHLHLAPETSEAQVESLLKIVRKYLA